MGDRVLVLGAGKIGRAIARFLTSAKSYEVTVADASDDALARLAKQTSVKTEHVDASDRKSLAGLMKDTPSVISALSYRFNPTVAEAALETGASYFDLTEDVETSRRVREISAKARKGQIFMPQCGLAPGFVSISAFNLTCAFESLDTVRMRVGALPQFPSNHMKYNLTWSTDGLINEYCNPCEAIHDGRAVEVLPLEGDERFSLDGINYEAFNTSGGLGTLRDTLAGRVRQLDYKTVRYPGHVGKFCAMKDLGLFDRAPVTVRGRPVSPRDVFKTVVTPRLSAKGEADLVVLRVACRGKRGAEMRVDLLDFFHRRSGFSAMERTTGFSAAIVMHFLARGEVKPGARAVPLFVVLHFQPVSP